MLVQFQVDSKATKPLLHMSRRKGITRSMMHVELYSSVYRQAKNGPQSCVNMRPIEHRQLDTAIKWVMN